MAPISKCNADTEAVANTISFPRFVSKLPAFIKGTPKRVKGMYIASRKPGDYPAGMGVCLEQSASRNPQGLALIFEEREFTYQIFNQWVNRLARSLLNSGYGKGDVIAVFMENRPELLACVAAIAKIGAVSALINTSQRAAVLRHSFELVDAKAIIVGRELFSAISEVESSLPVSSNARFFFDDADTLLSDVDPDALPDGWTDLAAVQRKESSENPGSTLRSRPSEAFCYFYTSGTTGLPKAAILTHGRFMKAFGGAGLACLQLTPRDRAYVTLPFYHGTALVVAWGSVLAGDACLVMARQFSASRFWSEVRRTQATAICYVGELCRYLMSQPESADDKNHQVRMIFGNGLRANLWAGFKQRFGVDKVMEFYGSSEGNVGFLNIFNHDFTVGFTTIPYAIVEYDLEEDCPVRHHDGFLRRVKKGQAGLLLGEITDKTPFDGYTDPEKTERTILRNVFKQGDAWFNTGDLMRDQGFNHAQFVDRLGDTFRWKGENVSTTEVENVLAQMTAVADAVVYGVEIPETNGRAGMASITLEKGAHFDSSEVYQHLSENLPAYARPIFIRLSSSMETTGTFKYKKTDLKKIAYDLEQITDPVWVCLPGDTAYQPFNAELQAAVEAGKYRF
ncbi:long-chain-acyl-CoA synthetase [Oleiphilus sp. HI0081]|nr:MULTISPECIES: long-chain-acyl-CoA synthetase [unclassified Oleiphilus]KZY44532.1 long-chain-acyl-CoA synthetase [Oleiphilus sp. HI0050]KZY75141.1 long-chain-acyl-CoA synthetase [Oleiphilus sp. HI0069]KZY77231.1 long-chain-acyl-CoA synthetase [Oleiphilus sp. HI0068]KZY87688.1 long-chain-acyl-CoA synthetase [Oleiphilus sp. HI0072]KZZ16164.1 long-chain-acyl-CoA synthetase [Oleiphilus sp. HI0078]KZZ18985.1 long-chain-acyl-CoA synthetase [Oleiphilus sp. HI0081]